MILLHDIPKEFDILLTREQLLFMHGLRCGLHPRHNTFRVSRDGAVRLYEYRDGMGHNGWSVSYDPHDILSRGYRTWLQEGERLERLGHNIEDISYLYLNWGDIHDTSTPENIGPATE